MLAVLLLALAVPLHGQSILLQPLQCGGMEITEDQAAAPAFPPLARRDVALRGQFCSEYSRGGWEDTMYLYLGEGAREYRNLIDVAVRLWNTALMGFNRRPVIEVVDHVQPTKFLLPGDFWSNWREASDANYDRQSVIYFKPAAEDISTGGFARARSTGNRMVEADIYLNTRTELQHGSGVALTVPILPLATGGTLHAYVDPLLVAVVHEIGHALGVKHVPVSGNIMSYNYMPAMQAKWLPAAEFLELTLSVTDNEDVLDSLAHEQVLPPVTVLTSDFDLYLRTVYSRSITLGEQDRMALMCIYDFEDWNDRPRETLKATGSGGVTSPILLYKVEPDYSEEARNKGIEGTVLLAIEVWEDGRAHNITVLESVGYGLDEEAIKAVQKWRFRPGTKNGKPVKTAARVEVTFRLKDDE